MILFTNVFNKCLLKAYYMQHCGRNKIITRSDTVFLKFLSRHEFLKAGLFVEREDTGISGIE